MIEELRLRSMLLNLLLELVLLCANNPVNYLPFLQQHERRHRLHLKLPRHILKHPIQKKKKIQNHSPKQQLDSMKHRKKKTQAKITDNSSTSILTKSTSVYFSAMAWIAGSMNLQGPHHDAEKSTTS